MLAFTKIYARGLSKRLRRSAATVAGRTFHELCLGLWLFVIDPLRLSVGPKHLSNECRSLGR
jgi:hypothetical protein